MKVERSTSRMFTTLLVILAVGTSTLFLIGCTPDQVKLVKAAGQTIERVIDSAISLLPTFVANGDITSDDAVAIQAYLGEGKSAINTFNATVAPFTSFDAKSKGDLARAFAGVTKALARLNAEGVTHIKDPVLRGRVQMGLTAINLAAGEIEAYFGDGSQVSARAVGRSIERINRASLDIEAALDLVARGE